MSEVSEGYRLCVFPAHKSSVAVESHPENQNVIITHGIRNVSVYDVKNQKLTNDWSVRGEQHITSAAIYSDHDMKFMCVTDENNILAWNPDETSIAKVKGKKVNKPILKLLSVPGCEAFILFKDGSLSLFSERDEHFVEPQLQDSQTIVWSGTNVVDKKLHIICLIENKNGSQTESEVLIYDIDTISKLTSHFKFKMNDSVTWKKGQVCSFHSSTDNYRLMTRESVGKDVIYIFDNQHGLSVIDVHIPNLSEKAVSAFVQDSQIVVGGLKSGNKVGIGVWDYRFNIMQSWQPFPENQGEIKQIFYSNKHAYLLIGKELYVYPITIKPSSIGSALGKMSFSVNQTPVVISKMEADTDCECEKLLNCLLEKNMKVGSHKFQEQFGKFMKRIAEEKDNIGLLHNHLAALLRKCVSVEKKIPRDILQQLITAKIIPGSMCQLLFPKLIEHKELTLLHLCLKHIQDIPEGPLVNCMEWFVSCPDSEYIEANGMECEINDEVDETECPFCLRKSLYINGILALPHNDVFLVECLKKCKFQTVLALLEYLQYCLQKMSPSTLPQDTNQRNPTISQVVDWISVVLDAHFTQFILSPEAKSLLADLHEVVQEQVKFYDEAASLEAIMSQIKHHGLVAQKRNTGLYSICTLKIF